ncbi:unnamed protein product [Rhizoctonia solani]|uniref:Uncharacterized protein n=1 Tax=Rhizoctonia solani TaxID=456999 RepID=A0A8H3DYB8_9AGAM|nr:unnamed protein product [Rhizoctonia solani]
MSQMPVTALNSRVPVSRRPSGQESVWQASVSQSYQQNSADPRAPYDPNASKPWLKSPEMLESLVPPSEREGTNSDGVPKRLAWLAKNGYTVHTYEEILSSRTRAPQISRKERRRLLMERKKMIFENAKCAHEEAKAPKKQSSTGLAANTTARGAYSHQISPVPERYPSEAPRIPCEAPQLDPSTYLDSLFSDADNAFSPYASAPFDVVMVELNDAYTHEEQIAYGFVPDYFYEHGAHPEFPAYPSTQSGNAYNRMG